MSNPLFQEYEHPGESLEVIVDRDARIPKFGYKIDWESRLHVHLMQEALVAHNLWLLDSLATKVLSFQGGLDIDGKQSKTYLMPYETIAYVAENVEEVLIPDFNDHKEIEVSGKRYRVTISPKSFWEENLKNIGALVKQDSRYQGLSGCTNVHFLIDEAEEYFNNPSNEVNEPSHYENYKRWMVELAVQRVNINNPWIQSVKDIMRVLGISSEQICLLSLSRSQRAGVVSLLQSVTLVRDISDLSALLEHIRSKGIANIAVAAHRNWREGKYGINVKYRIPNQAIFDIRMSLNDLPSSELGSRITEIRQFIESSDAYSAITTLEVLYNAALVVSERDDIQDPQVQAVLNDLVAQIKADFNPALLQAIIKIYEKSGKSFWDGLEDV